MVMTKATFAEESSYLRKVRKPLVEKQRRERMNHSISQLKLLIASTIKQQTAPMTRVDKADILELTVYHLTQLQQQERSATMATEAAAYNSGFKDCARESVTYLSNNKMAADTTVQCLNNHLQCTFVMNSRQRLPTTSSRCQRPSQTLSTPVSAMKSMIVSTPELCAADYSPIPLTGSHQAQGQGFYNGVSSASGSGYSPVSSFGDISSDSCYSSMSVSLPTSVSVSSSVDDRSCDVTSSGVVVIGDGIDNEIGHVITESVWRPW